MSNLQFLVDPNNLGITSSRVEPTLELLYRDDLTNILNELKSTNEEVLVELVASGKICVNKIITGRFGYNDNYKINDNWVLRLIRCSRSVFVFMVFPTNTSGLEKHRQGLEVIAKQHIKDKTQLNIWLDYSWFSKLFYLSEYALIINDDKLRKAIEEYDPAFDRVQYLKWINDTEWNLGHIHAIFRKYLKHQLQYQKGRR